MAETPPRRRKFRPGYLAPIEAERLLQLDPEIASLHRTLTESGLTLKPTIRPYLNKRRVVSIRFVWRQRKGRNGGVAVTFTRTEMIPLDDFLEAKCPKPT